MIPHDRHMKRSHDDHVIFMFIMNVLKVFT